MTEEEVKATPDGMLPTSTIKPFDNQFTALPMSDDEQNQSCPICLLSYAQILTEQEYAEASDYHVGGNVEEMGLRRLPCGTGDGTGTAGKGHIVCGKCAGKWLRLVSFPFLRRLDS